MHSINPRAARLRLMMVAGLATSALLSIDQSALAQGPVTPASAAPVLPSSQPVATANDPTLGALSQAQAKIYLLEQQIRQADLELKMARAQAQLQELRDALRQTRIHGAVVDVDASAPVLLSVQGGAKSGGLTGDLRFQDGSIQRVKSGDPVGQGWTVQSITPGQVVLAKSGKPLRILPLRLRPAGVTAIQVPVPNPAAGLTLPPIPRLDEPARSIQAPRAQTGAASAGGKP